MRVADVVSSFGEFWWEVLPLENPLKPPFPPPPLTTIGVLRLLHHPFCDLCRKQFFFSLHNFNAATLSLFFFWDIVWYVRGQCIISAAAVVLLLSILNFTVPVFFLFVISLILSVGLVLAN